MNADVPPPDPSGVRFDPVLSRVLVAVAELLAALAAAGSVLPPGTFSSTSAGPPAVRLSPTERQILAVLREARNPLKGVLIARRCGRSTATSHFRGCLASLVGKGLVQHVEDGYVLAGPGGGLPDAEVPGPGG